MPSGLIPDIKLNSRIFNPHRKKSKVEEANHLRDLKYQYFQKHEDQRKEYRTLKQQQSKDTQIKYSQNRESASILLLYRKTIPAPQAYAFLNSGIRLSDREEAALEEGEKINEKVLTIDELIKDFAKKNEEQIRTQYLTPNHRRSEPRGPAKEMNSRMLDKSFSKLN